MGGQSWRVRRGACSNCGTGLARRMDSVQDGPGGPGVDAGWAQSWGRGGRRGPWARQAATSHGEAQPPARLQGGQTLGALPGPAREDAAAGPPSVITWEHGLPGCQLFGFYKNSKV